MTTQDNTPSLFPVHSSVVVDTSRSPHARLKPVPISSVRFQNGFLGNRLDTLVNSTLEQQYEQNIKTNRIRNFEAAAGIIDVPFDGLCFNDSDLYKWIEAASWILSSYPDRSDLIEKLDKTIEIVTAAQDKDGYLNTYFQGENAANRWTDFDKHEMYMAGHLIQAGIAHYRSTGSNKLLDVAIKFADHICERFGGGKTENKIRMNGHPEIEMALVELYRATRQKRYLQQAAYFIDAREQEALADHPEFSPEHFQDRQPFRKMDEMSGHAVRAVYLECGGTDLYAETGESLLFDASNHRWEGMTRSKMYVTGGIGSSSEGERFGKPYDLPSGTAYSETCAAVGNIMWSYRLLLLTGQARYADILELALYNAALSGISLDGKSYFYDNPLASGGSHRRSEWFDCACCPSNIARTIASLPGYAASTSDKTLWIHLYESTEIDTTILGDQRINVKIETNYPWDGDVRITVLNAPITETTINLRIPGWAKGAEYFVDGIKNLAAAGGYASLSKNWQRGDEIRLNLPMEIRKLSANPKVRDTAGQIALARGPIIYCIEQADYPQVDLLSIRLPDDAKLSANWRADLLGGVSTLTGSALAIDEAQWGHELYKDMTKTLKTTPIELTAIPYFAWANREAGSMSVWITSI